MSAGAESATAAATSADSLRQEVRLAVVMTGGVSLCIWMGGVARELNLLLHRGVGASELAQRVRDRYQDLLDVLSTDVSVDVLSGTSAGGINAAILGLANVRDADIGSLRELWLTKGAFSLLLRDPKHPPVPSLLQGDGQLLAGLRTALQEIAASAGPVPAGAQDQPAHGSLRPTDVFITTTFLDGEPSRFVDDYGTLVSDVDHHGLFHFGTEQLAAGGAADQLALAGRCTASFPVAFESAHLTIGPASCDPTHPDMTDLSNASKACYVADGGLLANRPIAAAVRAVFDRPAASDVRRILFYVVPTAAPTLIPTEDAMPLLGTALLKDLAAMTSQAITADLAAIREHNESVRVRIDAYRQLAALAGRAAGHLVDGAMYRQYRLRVCDSQATALVDEALRQLDPAAIPLADDGTRTAGGRASALHANVTAALAAAMPDGVPATGDFDALGGLGCRGYDAAKTVALDLINRAYLARPDRDQRSRLAWARASVHDALAPPGPAAMDLTGIVASALGASSSTPTSASLATSLVTAWAGSQQTAAQLAAGWRALAAAVARATPTLTEVLTAADPVVGYLGSDPDSIAARLGQLHIAHAALLPDTRLADQQLELIQVSADTATDLDPRNQATQKLTGLQLHHFGAFYKYSWRASDWMWGRLDGAGWIVHALLDPRRLRTLRRLDDDPLGYGRRLVRRLGAIANATAPGDPAQDEDTPVPPAVARELDALWQEDTPAPASLPETAKWVAAGIQRIILAEELACVAEQIGVDKEAGATVSPAARAFLAAMRDPSADVTSRLAACQVSGETFAGEKDSRLFADTFKETFVVAIAALQDSGKIPALMKPGLSATKFEVEITPAGLLVKSASFLRRL
jgi:predicted acylesterase/phospholipase RssA